VNYDHDAACAGCAACGGLKPGDRVLVGGNGPESYVGALGTVVGIDLPGFSDMTAHVQIDGIKWATWFRPDELSKQEQTK